MREEVRELSSRKSVLCVGCGVEGAKVIGNEEVIR